ncbi:hypothetical protein HHL23_05535 [Chryseobacterium sp. RP-3-3]|uniref:Uncharacterized protein n=1 Tax=Chryseobacterium antibioticum TaxID=2728847 RepID=A0A7Y0FRB1_9FLAO|nr:hypothetical protein [Chryseobacterium antibioticum]NML69254.1 hypothetical protein [Chryseobacterium antibioticum]
MSFSSKYPNSLPIAKKSTTNPSEFVSVFTFEELLQEVEFDLGVKEFVVMEIDKTNYAILFLSLIVLAGCRKNNQNQQQKIAEGLAVKSPETVKKLIFYLNTIPRRMWR